MTCKTNQTTGPNIKIQYTTKTTNYLTCTIVTPSPWQRPGHEGVRQGYGDGGGEGEERKLFWMTVYTYKVFKFDAFLGT